MNQDILKQKLSLSFFEINEQGESVKKTGLANNIKFYLLLTFALFFAGLNNSQAQFWLYAKQDGGDNAVHCRDVAADASPLGTGSHYTTGDWGKGNINLSGITLSSKESSFYVAKYKPINTGGIEWAVQGTAMSQEDNDAECRVNKIVVDPAGNSYIIGTYAGVLSVKGQPPLIDEPLQRKPFIAKFDPNGVCLYLRQVSGPTCGVFMGEIAVDDAGNAYVAGAFCGKRTFGAVLGTTLGITLEADGGQDAFPNEDVYIAKFDDKGFLQWVHQAGGTLDDGRHPDLSFEGGVHISASPSGNCYVTAPFRGLGFFGATNYVNGIGLGGAILISKGKEDIFVAQYDTKGNFKWVQQIGSVDDDFPRAIETDASENTYVTGNLTTATDFNGPILSPQPDASGFLAKYNVSGTLQANKLIGGTVNGGLTVDSKNAILYIAGRNDNTATFDGKTFSIGGLPHYIVGYNTDNMTFSWYQHSISRDDISLASDNHKNCYAAGHFFNKALFGNISLSTKFENQFVALLLVSDLPKFGEKQQSIRNGQNDEVTVIDNLPTNEQNIVLYPNPVSDMLKMSKGAKGITVKIINSLSQVMYQGEAFDQKDISGWPSGIYVAIISNGQQIKFIKK